MCGIIGYIGKNDALPIICDGLKNLEYRGYDSAGIALIENNSLSVYKQSGEIDELSLPGSSGSRCGVGHTRWSTHGEPTDKNAHPHIDCNGEIAVVHNGIIDNYQTLKDELSHHRFSSETDTEVIPHLIEEILSKNTDEDIFTAIREAIKRLEGSFAIAITIPRLDGIIVARQDSPLVIGHGENANYIASDVPAFIEHTRKVTYLEDGDIAHITNNDVEILNGGEVVERSIEEVDWEAEDAEKSGYDHYMLKEIHEQPKALRQTLSGRINKKQGTVDLDISLPKEYIDSLEEIQIVAAGTSYHAGLYASKLIEEFAGIRCNAYIASEYEFKGGRDPWRTLVIAVTQSGETADTLKAIRKAKKSGTKTLTVTNTVGSTITREVEQSIFIRAGPEIGVAATKTFISQVATLTLLIIYIARKKDRLGSKKATKTLENIRRLPGSIQQILDQESKIKKTAKKYGDKDAFFYIGRKLGYPVALEGALKLKEISYDHAEGFPAGELKHGPLALVTKNTPVLAILTKETKPQETLNNIKEVESREAPVIGLTSNKNETKYLDITLDIPSIGVLEPLLANVWLQLFSYYVAKSKDRPIDKPRNLAKSVTVE